jgi:hypothetical protein
VQEDKLKMKFRISEIFLISLSLFVFLSMDNSALYGGMRCGTKLASTGDTKYEVMAKCGAPDYKEIRYEKRIRRDFYRDLFRNKDLSRYESERNFYREPLLVEELVEIEEWTYNLGPTSFVRYLIFENGRLVDIVTGDYGF